MQTSTTQPVVSVPQNIIVHVQPLASTKIWLLPIIGSFIILMGMVMWIGFTMTAVSHIKEN